MTVTQMDVIVKNQLENDPKLKKITTRDQQSKWLAGGCSGCDGLSLLCICRSFMGKEW